MLKKKKKTGETKKKLEYKVKKKTSSDDTVLKLFSILILTIKCKRSFLH